MNHAELKELREYLAEGRAQAERQAEERAAAAALPVHEFAPFRAGYLESVISHALRRIDVALALPERGTAPRRRRSRR